MTHRPPPLDAAWPSLRSPGDALLDVHLRAAGMRRRRALTAGAASTVAAVLAVLLALAPSGDGRQELRMADPGREDAAQEAREDVEAPAPPAGGAGAPAHPPVSRSAAGDPRVGPPTSLATAPAAREVGPLLVDPAGDVSGDATRESARNSADLRWADLRVRGADVVAEIAVTAWDRTGNVEIQDAAVEVRFGEVIVLFEIGSWRGTGPGVAGLTVWSQREYQNRQRVDAVVELDATADVFRIRQSTAQLNELLARLRASQPDLRVGTFGAGSAVDDPAARVSVQAPDGVRTGVYEPLNRRAADNGAAAGSRVVSAR